MTGDLFDWARTDEPRADDVLSVSELTGQIKERLEGEFAEVWVEGEVSGLTDRRRHLYFSLKDSEAVLRAVIWSSQRRRMQFEPREGDRVICRGRIDVYPPRGQYTLVVRELVSKGLGALLARKKEVEEKLAAEGLTDAGRKRPLPFLPRRVGVVTSPTGAAVRDFLYIALGRFPRADVLIAPAVVQGDAAGPSVIRALRMLGRLSDVDVVVVTRGGGSVEDLWCFNLESVARAIAAHPVPVVSAVGHERDSTIADLVADARCATPTAAAERVFPNEADLRDRLGTTSIRLEQAMARHEAHARSTVELAAEGLERTARATMRRHRESLERTSTRLAAGDPQRRLRAQHRALENLKGRLLGCGRTLLGARRTAFETVQGRLSARGSNLASSRRPVLDPLRQRLVGRGPLVTAEHRAEIREFGGRLHALSPLRVLDRGYALARTMDGRVLTDTGQVRAGHRLDLRLRRGSLGVTVDAVVPEATADEGEAT